MARSRHHKKRHANAWNRKFGAAARRAKASCSTEFIRDARAGKVHTIQPYFKCIGRHMKKALK